MNVLFIAYYFEPYPGVGAKRITYWAKNLKRLDSRINNCDVITTIEQSNKNISGVDNVFFVPESSNSFLGKIIKFDIGASWLKNLNKFFDNRVDYKQYDYAVLTGNPFFHFFIIKKLKKLGIKTIIDFRDPLSNNPRSVKADTLKRKIKSVLLSAAERYFIRGADITITVNSYCARLLTGFDKFKQKIKIIDNGFEEKYFLNLPVIIEDNGVINLAYAGSLYADRSPLSLISAITNDNDFVFNHIGNINTDIANIENVVSHGPKSYPEAIDLMNQYQVLVIFTSGHNFESTTKIFDYLALNKVILILTEGQIKTGALHEITKNYPNIYWARNTAEAINTVLTEIKATPFNQSFFDPMQYSREAGLRKLISLMT